jgi:hypothetical protein
VCNTFLQSLYGTIFVALILPSATCIKTTEHNLFFINDTTLESIKGDKNNAMEQAI